MSGDRWLVAMLNRFQLNTGPGDFLIVLHFIAELLS